MLRHFSVFLFVIFLGCILNNSYGQLDDGTTKSTAYSLPQITPHAPNAASLGKYGEIPVSLSNGMANVSIPLFTVQIGSFTLPINLTYHNNGLKVDDIPSYVGHGWDVSGYGVINHEQRGLDDLSDTEPGMFSTLQPQSQPLLNKYLTGQMTAQEKFDYLEDVIEGVVDAEYDLYSFNFFGHSGQFYMDANKNIIVAPKSDLIVAKTDDGFKIVDGRGNQYFFYYGETTTMYPYWPDDLVPVRKLSNTNGSYGLGKIITAENRTIWFQGQTYPFNYLPENDFMTVAYPGRHSTCPGNSYGYKKTMISLANGLLTRIVFDEGYIDFKLSTDSRADIATIAFPNTDFVPYLDRIQLFNKQGVLVKDFDLLHSYFDGGGRLRLDGVARMNNNEVAEKWTLGYTSTDVPAIFQAGKDHWGYSTGAGSGHIIDLPGADYKDVFNFVVPGGMPTVNRNSNYLTASKGVLKSITYPTGGSTTFEYEPNQVVYKYYHDLATNPWLKYKVTPSMGNLASAISDDGPELSGSFTLTSSVNLIKVSALKEMDWYSFTRSSVTLSNQPGGTDIIQSKLGWNCQQGTTYCYCNGEIELGPGTYYWTVIKNLDAETNPIGGYAYLNIDGTKDEFDQPFALTVGGVRIASIQNNSITGITSKKRYIYDDQYEKVNFQNKPWYVTSTRVGATQSGEGYIYFCVPCGTYYKIHDESVIPFSGNSVEYLYVTEMDDDQGNNGKTEYHFYKTEPLSGGGFPYVTPYMASWRTGVMDSKKIYKKVVENGVPRYDPIQTISNQYGGDEYPTSWVKGIKADYWSFCDFDNINYRELAVMQQDFYTANFYQTAASETLLDNTGNIVNASQSKYNSTFHTLPTEVITTNSKKEEIRELIKYSFDYPTTTCNDAASLGIRALKDKNILVPVEKLTVKKIDGVDYVTGGTLMTYNSNTGNLSTVYELTITAPVLLANITQSNISTDGLFFKDSRFKEKAVADAYDNNKNVLQRHYSNNVYQSFIYDYDAYYTIAAVENATYNSVAYTSFEANGTGNWTLNGSVQTGGITGKNAFNGSVSMHLTDARNMTVTCWSYGNNVVTVNQAAGTVLTTKNNWTLYQWTLNNVTDITVSGNNIDEVKAHPQTAQMTTFTYEPLIGLTSQCDVNNRISYYEYDNFGRLALIRDQDKNILKKFSYSYTGQ